MRSFVKAGACISIMLAGLTVAATASAQSSAAKNEAIYSYQGADRNQKLLEEAKKEGTLTWYTSLAPNDSTPMAQAFEKKYGIKVEVWRALSEKVVQRVVTEGRAKRYAFDVVESNGPELEMISREKLLSPFFSPHFTDLPSYAIPAHRMWIADRMTVYGVAYNTKQVKREDLPKNYEGFLDPKWKGKLGIEAGDGDWMAAAIRAMGQEKGMNYMRKLADMRPDVRTGHLLLVEMVSAGELPIGLTAYQANAIALKQKGGPIDFVALDPIVVRPQAIGLAKNAQHPHAALLFADFMLSPDGQGLLESLGRSPVSNKIKSEFKSRQVTMIEPAMVVDESEKWQKMWDGLFVKK